MGWKRRDANDDDDDGKRNLMRSHVVDCGAAHGGVCSFHCCNGMQQCENKNGHAHSIWSIVGNVTTPPVGGEASS